ncbi:hypothetical protein ACOMCU_26940 [Lysinibacillus sp. UGB7]|uniref:hypothetical protein n=1 Tax=Lysinibacillus sp. UGB7 TaxID=3411039 RepID=UPI003B7F58EE
MENKYNKLKLHFAYFIFIAFIIVVWLISYIFMKSNYAGSLLNFAGTVTSIILAVLAIMITLLDIANQKNNINELKESVSNLREVSEEMKILIINNNDDINKKILNLGDYGDKIQEVSTSLTTFGSSIEDNPELLQLKEKLNILQETINEKDEMYKELKNNISTRNINSNTTNKYKYYIIVEDDNELGKFEQFVNEILTLLGTRRITITTGGKEQKLQIESDALLKKSLIGKIATQHNLKIIKINIDYF